MKFPIFKLVGFIVFIVIIGILAGGVVYVAFIAFAVSNSKNDVVQHSVSSPDNKVIALVISDNCGATCGCRIRVDLQTGDNIRKEVFRDEKSCDASVVWLDDNRFEVQPDSGKSMVIDVNTLGLAK
ncbi:MAG: DUF5412 family protein [Chloroflexota bacterium]